MRCSFTRSFNSTNQKVEKIDEIIQDKHQSNVLEVKLKKFELIILACEQLKYYRYITVN